MAVTWYYYNSLEIPETPEKANLIRVFNIEANQTVKSPLLIIGEARGNWYFEASFPIKILDENDELVALGIAQAKEDWMTENFVPFEVELQFYPPDSDKGTIVLEKDNPSGLPENADELRIPIVFGPKQEVELYYYNQFQDPEIGCLAEAVLPIKRKIFITNTPIQDTVRLLLEGNLTEQEQAAGFTTEFPLEGVRLKGANFLGGVLTLEFDDLLNKTGGGSCRVSVLWAQISKTAKQFPGVLEVKFQPEFLFQP